MNLTTLEQSKLLKEWGAPEFFVPVVGYEGLYQVSNIGRIKSSPRWRSRGGIIKQSGGEYKRVTLYKNNVAKNHSVHRIVAEAFLGSPLPGQQVNHKDLDKHNNHVLNLEWCSHLENKAHAKALGHVANNKGAKHGMVKLTEEQALYILKSGESPKDLQKKFGISHQTVSDIRNGKRWKHLS